MTNVKGPAGGVSLYATDATTGQTTGAVYRPRQEPRRDVGGWLHLAENHLRLGAGQSEIVPFRIAIPRTVRAGEHLGGIVAQPDLPRARITNRRGNTTFHVQVRELEVIAVEMVLPGPRIDQLAITGIRPGAEPSYQTLLLGLASTGTVLTKGDGSVIVTDAKGRERLDQTFPLDTFVPDTRIEYPVQVAPRALPPGNYRAAITISYGRHQLTRVLPFSISTRNLSQAFGSRRTVPPSTGQSIVPYIAGGLALLLVGFTVGARVRARPSMKA